MREIFNLNEKWAFSKEAIKPPVAMPQNWYWVNLPHTWNAIDGQDGGNDYYRGTCFYAKEVQKEELPEGEQYYLEFLGVNASADVYVNGNHLDHHDVDTQPGGEYDGRTYRWKESDRGCRGQ